MLTFALRTQTKESNVKIMSWKLCQINSQKVKNY